MPKTINIDCSACPKKDKGCCKTCFNEREISVFHSLKIEEVDKLMHMKQVVIYGAGEVIVRQNTPATFAVCIKSGLAKISVSGINKKKVIVKIVNNHDFITGGELFNGNLQPYSLTAITPVECCLVDSSKLSALFTQNSAFAIALLKHHTKQSTYILSRLVNLTQKYMPGRVADTLVYLADEIYRSDTFKVPLNRQQLAEMSNMTKEGFVRILHEFKDSQIISTQSNSFSILDKDALIAISKNG